MRSSFYERCIFSGVLLLIPLATFLGWSSRNTWGNLLLAGAVFILLLLDALNGFRDTRPRVPYTLLIFFGLAATSTFVSTYRYESLISLLQLGAGIAIFDLAKRYFRALPLQRTAAGVLIVCGTVIAIHALTAVPALSNLELGVSSTFGWKNALAGFLALVGPMVIAGLLHIRPWYGKTVLAIALAAIATALFFTTSQAGWLAFGFGGAFVIGILTLNQKKLPLTWIVWLIIPAILATGAVSLLLNVNGGLGSATASASTTIDRLAWGVPYSANTRIAYWKTSFEIAKNFPLLGVGLGNFTNWYTHFFKEPWLFTVSPHNYLLYLLVSLGFPAVLVFIFFLLATGYKTTRWLSREIRLRTSSSTIVLTALWAGGIAGLFLQGLMDLSLEVPTLSLLLWLSLGMLYANLDEQNTTPPGIGNGIVRITVASGLTLVTLLAIYADNLYQRGTTLQTNYGNTPGTIALLEWSYRLMPLSANTAEVLANAHWDAVLKHSGDRQTNMDTALRYANIAVTLDPASAHRQWMLGTIYFYTQTPSRLHWPQIIYHLEQAIVYDFHDPTYYRTLAEAYLRLGRPDQALAAIDRGLVIYPNSELQKIISGAAIYQLFGLREKLESLQQLRQAIEPPAEN